MTFGWSIGTASMRANEQLMEFSEDLTEDGWSPPPPSQVLHLLSRFSRWFLAACWRWRAATTTSLSAGGHQSAGGEDPVLTRVCLFTTACLHSCKVLRGVEEGWSTQPRWGRGGGFVSRMRQSWKINNNLRQIITYQLKLLSCLIRRRSLNSANLRRNQS